MGPIDAIRVDEPSQRSAPFILMPDQHEPLEVVGEQITVLASGAQTGGYEIFHQIGPEGSGPPPHTHPWDESFYVISGDVTFSIDGRAAIAVPGALVHFPAGTVHQFRFGKGGAEMLSVTSCEGASHLFVDVDREVSPDHPDLARLIEVSGWHGLKVFPPTN